MGNFTSDSRDQDTEHKPHPSQKLILETLSVTNPQPDDSQQGRTQIGNDLGAFAPPDCSLVLVLVPNPRLRIFPRRCKSLKTSPRKFRRRLMKGRRFSQNAQTQRCDSPGRFVRLANREKRGQRKRGSQDCTRSIWGQCPNQ